MKMFFRFFNTFKPRSLQYVSDKWSLYINFYHRIFASYKNINICLLEIGIQNGGSLNTWANYFNRKSTIVGCDINPDCAKLKFNSKKIHVIVGDIKLPSTLQSILALSSSYDIIIDDASHTSHDVIQTFCALFGHVKDGGMYVVEDLHTSYWKDYGGGLYHSQSSYTFFKALIDVGNHEHWGISMQPVEYLQSLGFETKELSQHLSHIHSIEFLNSLCVIRKMKPELNSLGPRYITGEIENVFPIKHLNGQISKAPDQSENPYSIKP